MDDFGIIEVQNGVRYVRRRLTTCPIKVNLNGR
jgi:hypothetical protein